MQINNRFTRANHARQSFLRLSILLSAVFLLNGFPTNAFGQIAIPLSELNPKLTESIIGKVKAFEFVEERLFIGTEKGLWILEDDNSEAKQVTAIKEPVLNLHVVGNQIIAETGKNIFGAKDNKVNVWIVSNNGATIKIEGIDENIASYSIVDAIVVGEHFFILADAVNKGGKLWIVDKQGKAKLVEIPMVVSMVRTGNEVMVSSTSSLFLVDQNGDAKVFKIGLRHDLVELKSNRIRSVAYGGAVGLGRGIIKIDGNKFISSEFTPDSWWGNLIVNIFPENYLPAGKISVIAYYTDVFGNKLDEKVLPENYKEVLPGGFRFAMGDGDTMPPDEKFSLQGVFTYEIGLGKNEVHYWIKDKNENVKEIKKTYYGIPGQYFIAALPIVFAITSTIFILGCFFLAPKARFCHSAIMNPWLRKYFSFGSVPLLVASFPSLRRYILRRYRDSVNKDKEFNEWKTRFVFPNEEFLPENFGKKLNDERKLLLIGQSGIGKTSFFKYLTAYYASENKPIYPAKVFPVYISLTNYGGNSLEDLIYNQLFAYGKITDKELAPMFLEQGGLLIFLDGVNEVQNINDRQKLSEFVEKFWTSNYICLSSQQSYPEIENIPKIELKAFSAEKVCEFIRNRVYDKDKAEDLIENLTDEDYQLYSVPRDLEFAIEIINNGEKSLPKSRTELYKTVFSSMFVKWKENGRVDAEGNLCEHAYTMIAEHELAFDLVENPRFKEITTDLFEQKFLIKREKNYNFRHDLIRSYLASEYFRPRWQNLFAVLGGKKIDSNWLEMLKFSCENIKGSNEIKSLVYEVLERSMRKDLVKDLVKWLKANQPSKCKTWEKDFYAQYGSLDFT